LIHNRSEEQRRRPSVRAVGGELLGQLGHLDHDLGGLVPQLQVLGHCNAKSTVTRMSVTSHESRGEQ
jgi:hypothetical protein